MAEARANSVKDRHGGSNEPEAHAFRAEVAKLLDLMVHSVYSQREVFLRELISNAADACDKLRYEAIAAPGLITDGEPPKIKIIPNKRADTLAVVTSDLDFTSSGSKPSGFQSSAGTLISQAPNSITTR